MAHYYDLSSSLVTEALGVTLDNLFGGINNKGKDEHKHKCAKCGTVFDHDRNDLGNYELAHSCPRCGHDERQKYFGELPSEFRCDGRGPAVPVKGERK